jgi:nucleoside-diphosphate-sugar epimerase
MSVLITGAAGFIGSTLGEKLLSQGETVIGIDAFTDYYSQEIKRDNLRTALTHDRYTFMEGDITTLHLAPILETVDCVFHTAGQPGVRGSWGTQFDAYVQNNIVATQRLLETIKETGKKIKVVYSSSSSIYGNVSELPITEKARPQPYSPYGTTKLAAEHLCLLYHANYGVPVVALRYFTVYGPRQRPDMAFHIFSKAILQNQPITVLGDGNQTRDFTYVGDIVDANILAYQNDVNGQIFNLGGGCRIAVNGVLEMLEEISGQKITVQRKDSIKGDVKDTWADTTQAKTKLGFTPKISLKDGLQREFEWAQTLYERHPS